MRCEGKGTQVLVRNSVQRAENETLLERPTRFHRLGPLPSRSRKTLALAGDDRCYFTLGA